MKKKPWIGLVPLIDPERESLWMLPGYMEGVLAAGGIPVMLPLTEENTNIPELLDRLDALIFTGGHDVSPLFTEKHPSRSADEAFRNGIQWKSCCLTPRLRGICLYWESAGDCSFSMRRWEEPFTRISPHSIRPGWSMR